MLNIKLAITPTFDISISIYTYVYIIGERALHEHDQTESDPFFGLLSFGTTLCFVVFLFRLKSNAWYLFNLLRVTWWQLQRAYRNFYCGIFFFLFLTSHQKIKNKNWFWIIGLYFFNGLFCKIIFNVYVHVYVSFIKKKYKMIYLVLYFNVKYFF